MLEAYAYTKRGSNRTLLKILKLIESKFSNDVMNFYGVDEAILLTNALVELRPQNNQDSNDIEDIRVKLIQSCIDYIILHAEDVKFIDQQVLLLNTLMSDIVLSGRIELDVPEPSQL